MVGDQPTVAQGNSTLLDRSRGRPEVVESHEAPQIASSTVQSPNQLETHTKEDEELMEFEEFERFVQLELEMGSQERCVPWHETRHGVIAFITGHYDQNLLHQLHLYLTGIITRAQPDHCHLYGILMTMLWLIRYSGTRTLIRLNTLGDTRLQVVNHTL